MKDAAAWSITLQESPDDEEVAVAFLDWLSASDANAAAWSHIEDARVFAKEEAQKPSVQPILQSPPPAVHELSTSQAHAGPLVHSPETKRNWIIGSFAAAALLAIAYFGPMLSVLMRADHLTGRAQTKIITLADGTTTLLGAESALTTNMTNSSRSVTLLQGSAYFAIKQDQSRPFVVRAANLNAQAIGTAFEVRHTSAGAAVAVSEGVVEVSRSAVANSSYDRQKQALRVSSGQQLETFGPNGNAMSTRPIKANQIASWQKGELSFQDWPVEDVIATLRRHYRGVLIIAPGISGRDRMSGVYDLNDPIASLRLLALARGLKVRQVSPWLAFISQF